MTDVFTLLSLPSSAAFTTYRAKSDLNVNDNSGSLPRKTPRLTANSDSASASRSRAVDDRAAESKGPITITIIGDPIPSRPDSFYDGDYNLVVRSISVLLSRGDKEQLPGTYEKIYNACRTSVCIANKGEGLYGRLKMEVERCVGTIARSLREDGRQGVKWLEAFIEACSWFEKQVGLLESLLAYLDKVYLTGRKDLPSIHNLCYAEFAKNTFGHDITLQLRAGIKEWIEWERRNEVPHELRPNIVKLISRLHHHGHYVSVFEKYYMQITYDYYQAESAECAEHLSALEFLKHCQKRRTEEIQRAQQVLPELSWSQIVDITMRALLGDRLEWIVLNGLPRLMDTYKHDELRDLYELFDSVEGTSVILEGFKLYIQTKVTSIVKDTAHDEEMVEKLLHFKAFTDHLVSDAFASQVVTLPPIGPSKPSSSTDMQIDPSPPPKVPNKEFQYALSDAFRNGFRARRNKPAEMIAKYIDKAMRKGQKGKKDSEFEEVLDKVLGLYRSTDDKDVFRTFYHRALAKRLLLEKSASDDVEKAMLKKLKDQYDPDFSMGDHMFNDLALSRDTMREYNEHRQRLGDDPDSQKLTAMVLQRSFWPFAARQNDVDLPPKMQSELTKYTTFYKIKHQGHKLDWDHALGTATLRARFRNGEKELSVSLYQAVILLLFNEESQISFLDIKERTRIDDAELRRTLQSLACGKKRVLKKQPVGKDVNDGDVFLFDTDFSDPAYRIHINSIQVKETVEESRKTQTLIESDRKHVLDAAIVRIMKAKKEVHMEQLKALTIDAVKNHFIPDVGIIKERIEELVEQEYMKRSEKDKSAFTYIA